MWRGGRALTTTRVGVSPRPYDDGVADPDDLAERFSAHRAHLLNVAYRLTGSLADAEDAVQEAWLRLDGLSEADRARIRDLRAWLTTVVARICLDRLTSAAVRRERYVGPWLPEPIVTGPDGNDPLATVVRDDGLRMAAMVVLDRLTPEQRVAFVLHDAFSVPFSEIAALLGCSEAAARQYASRGRRAVADADPPPRVALTDQRAILERFVAAFTAGDTEALVSLLHPDVVLIGDGGGKAQTARRVIVGAEKIVRFFSGLLARYGTQVFDAMRPVLVNGDLGVVLPERPGREPGWTLNRRVMTIAIRDGRIAQIYDVVNPDKLTRVAW